MAAKSGKSMHWLVLPGRSGALALILVCGASLVLSGCQTPVASGMARGSEAYKVIPATDPGTSLVDYTIGPLDTLDITVFQETDLSMKGAKVDAGGQILMPLIGPMKAAGRTPRGLSQDIAARLSEKYLESPQVSVVVTSAVSQRVAVEGSVNEAGVFEIEGHTTLLEVLAMAKGTSRTAALGEVIVFRNIRGERTAALFNVSHIQKGAAPDPEIVGNDLVVVGFSNLKAGWRDLLGTAPLINLFRPY
ncbi:MAG: protein GumB [Sphingomonas bacterium]|jgi:polysaccharide export outer membrane protein|nr:protein GumB [Sphingomonas bacterium]